MEILIWKPENFERIAELRDLSIEEVEAIYNEDQATNRIRYVAVEQPENLKWR